MGTLDKLKTRIQKIPADFTYKEGKRLLQMLGYEELNKGKTSGSRVKFYRETDQAVIMLHKPHPGSEMRKKAVQDIVQKLKEYGDL